MPDPRLATLLPGDRGRMYTHPITREQHVSSTTVLKTLAKELSGWAAGLAAGEAWDNREWLLRVSRQQAVDALRGAPFRTRDERGDHGSYVHNGAELLAMSASGYMLDVGQQALLTSLVTGMQGEAVRQGVFRFAEWAHTYVAEWLHLEQTVWGNGWAGTFDAIVRLKDGRVALVDYKTGKGIYREVKLQLASYFYAPIMLDANGNETPMPQLDLAAVLHLPESGGYTFIDLEIDPDDFEDFERVLEHWHWTQRVPLNSGVAIPVATAPNVPGVRECGHRRKGGSIACTLDQGHAGEHKGKSKTGSRNYVWPNENVPEAGTEPVLSASLTGSGTDPGSPPAPDLPLPDAPESTSPGSGAAAGEGVVQVVGVPPVTGGLDHAEPRVYSQEITAMFLEPQP